MRNITFPCDEGSLLVVQSLLANKFPKSEISRHTDQCSNCPTGQPLPLVITYDCQAELKVNEMPVIVHVDTWLTPGLNAPPHVYLVVQNVRKSLQPLIDALQKKDFNVFLEAPTQDEPGFLSASTLVTSENCAEILENVKNALQQLA